MACMYPFIPHYVSMFNAHKYLQVGDVFLKNAYFSVDVGKNAISLAVPT